MFRAAVNLQFQKKSIKTIISLYVFDSEKWIYSVEQQLDLKSVPQRSGGPPSRGTAASPLFPHHPPGSPGPPGTAGLCWL